MTIVYIYLVIAFPFWLGSLFGIGTIPVLIVIVFIILLCILHGIHTEMVTTQQQLKELKELTGRTK
jgi:hypothetical protein